MSSPPPLLVVGSVALDTIRTPFGSVREALGGSATHFACSARFFSRVAMVAVVGEDFPKRHLDRFRSLGVDTGGMVRQAGKTFRWKGFYGEDLNVAHTLKTELNVFEGFSPRLSDSQKRARVVFLANSDPDLQAAVLDQMHAPRIAACDTMNFWIDRKRKPLLRLLRRVHIFFCNDQEARQLSGESRILDAARWLLSRGPRWIVIKKGEHGVLCRSAQALFVLPAYLLGELRDPTGAGDSFAGGFMASLCGKAKLSGQAVRLASLYGSVMASFNVERFGCERLQALQLREIETRCRVFRRMTSV